MISPALTILTIAVITFLTRLIPFLLFPANKKRPPFIDYLNSVLPYAIMGMLVIYCFKDTSFISAPWGIPKLAAGAFVILVHKWKHNLLLSIGGGTILYMFLVQAVF